MKNDNFSLCVQHWTTREGEREGETDIAFYISAKKKRKKSFSISLFLLLDPFFLAFLSLSLFLREKRKEYERFFCFLVLSLFRAVVL